jgi:DNA processing protein
MITAEKLNWLRLARSENVGKSTFFRLIKIFGAAETALEKIADLSQQVGRRITICSSAEVEKELLATQKFGAEILLFSEEKYPRLLREIPDPAPVLTVKGETEFFNRDTIAVVGPRNPSFGAISFAKKIAAQLGENSIITVSGMARGIDSAAHIASLASGTIAVIAGGIDHIYPKENDELYAAIAKQGLLVSETPFGAPPKGGNFVQRNRIISGLSLAVIVVEAGLKSGSLITARYAAEQGREVFAVPGSPFDPRCHGTNRLIKDGANMLESIDDVLNEFAGIKARFSEVGILREPESEEFVMPITKMPSDDDLKNIREEIFSKLSFIPIAIEEIIAELQAPARLVNIALVQLELADKIEISFGKVVLRP